MIAADRGHASANADRSDCKRCGGSAVLDPELCVDLLKMLVDGTRTEIENFGNVAIRFAARDPQQNLRLALGHGKFPLEQHPVVAYLTFYKPQQILVCTDVCNVDEPHRRMRFAGYKADGRRFRARLRRRTLMQPHPNIARKHIILSLEIRECDDEEFCRLRRTP